MEIAVQGGQLAVALFGTLLLAWESRRTRPGGSGHARRLGDRTYAALAVLGVAAYVRFGTLHQGRFVHIWDTYHYYVGAKYSPELGYDLLYECTALADAESGLRRDVAARTMTDLRTNQQVTTLEILRHPETCLRRFSPARWDSFQHDVAWFRDRVDWRTWHQIQRDHGYNATPVWNALGHVLADLAPASDLQITCLALLDPALLAAALLLLGCSFGWRVCAIAALTLGTFYPSRFYWTGGAFLRFDWLFCIIAGLCALKKQRPLLGGAVLAYAALLRLFPAVLFVGPALAALEHVRRTRTWDRAHLRLFAGAAIAVAIAVPAAFAISGDCGKSFVENTIKHAETPLTNHMGLPTLLSYRPNATVQQLRERSTTDLWPRFKQARLEARDATRPVIVAAGLVCLVLLVRAARQEVWRTAALSLVLVPVLLQLTCYYYVFVIALAVLAESRPRVGVVLLGMCTASMVLAVGLAPRVGMDETYLASSLVTMLGLCATWALGLAPRLPDEAMRPRLLTQLGP